MPRALSHVNAILVAMLIYPACGRYKVSVCRFAVEDAACQLSFQLSSRTIRFGEDQAINIQLSHESETGQIQGQLLQGSAAVQLDIAAVDSRNYILKMPRAQTAHLALGSATLEIEVDGSLRSRQGVRISRLISYGRSPDELSTALRKSELPWIDQLGISQGIVYGLALGTSALGEMRRVRKYIWNDSTHILEEAGIDYLSGPLGPSAKLAVTRDKLYLSQNPGTGVEEVLACPARVQPAQSTDCQRLGYALPPAMGWPTTKAMVVSPDGGSIVQADSDGALQWGAVTMMPPGWKGAVISVAGPAARVELAMGDFNGDQQMDLVGVWLRVAAGEQQARVLLWNGNGYVEDQEKSEQLQAELGSRLIDALAAGDLDGDGYADVVYGRGTEVGVLQNQLDGFKNEWRASPPVMGGEQIGAVAVGKVDGKTEIGKGLDIVVSTNTAYRDVMGTSYSTLTLRVFRPQ